MIGLVKLILLGSVHPGIEDIVGNMENWKHKRMCSSASVRKWNICNNKKETEWGKDTKYGLRNVQWRPWLLGNRRQTGKPGTQKSEVEILQEFQFIYSVLEYDGQQLNTGHQSPTLFHSSKTNLNLFQLNICHMIAICLTTCKGAWECKIRLTCFLP